jgi:hypothetical protein
MSAPRIERLEKKKNIPQQMRQRERAKREKKKNK